MKAVDSRRHEKLHHMVGTMIEIPRTAMTADEIAKGAEFFSFGTNHLTQTTMRLSRDDYTKFSKHYEDRSSSKRTPFAVLDQEGVGKVVELALKLGRQNCPDLEIGICGEHGGEPSSVAFCCRTGMNYVSCTPTVCPSHVWLWRQGGPGRHPQFRHQPNRLAS